MNKKTLLASLSFLPRLQINSSAQTTLVPYNGRYIYNCGETAKVVIYVNAKSKLENARRCKLTVTDGSGKQRCSKEFDPAVENPFVFELTSATPGFLQIAACGEKIALAFSPEKLEQGYPEPAGGKL